MKKCPYCGHVSSDEAVVCEKCCAGFPAPEPKKEKPVQPKKAVKGKE